MAERIAAEGFLPGEFITEELDAHGWNQLDLAEILGKTPGMVNELIKGKRKVSPEIAEGLASAFGTSAEYWTNLETAYQYWILRKERSHTPVSARKARLMSLAPYRELIRRGWVESSTDIDVLEENVLSFLGVRSFDEPMPNIRHATRKSSSYAEVSPSLRAYLCKARQIARGVHAERFNRVQLLDALDQLKVMRRNREDTRLIPKVLADAGVRLLVVEHLTGTKVDGATLWIDNEAPVIVLSLRYDRIDSFWFTLMHEIGHILNDDGEVVDSELEGENAKYSDAKPEAENMADKIAVEFLVPQDELQNFINNHSPRFYNRDIQGFAHVHNVHPGIVVGQLQHRGDLKHYHFRELLEKVRHTVTDSTLTDGWGTVIAGI